MVVGDWRLADGQINELQVEDLVEIDEIPESNNSGNKTFDAEYVADEDDFEIDVQPLTMTFCSFLYGLDVGLNQQL